MSKYILRRNDWGKPSCTHIVAEYPELKVINKDEDKIPHDAEWVIRWATTSNFSLPTIPKVINKAGAIHKVFNKGSFRAQLAAEGLAPRTWLAYSYYLKDGGHLPVIIRPLKHSASEDLHYCVTEEEVSIAFQGLINKGYYISEFIEKDHEYRVFLANSRVLAVMEKIPDDPQCVSWGIDERWEYVGWYDWNLEVCHIACESFRHSELDIGAVDIMTKDGVAYCLEVNSGPLVSPYYGKQLAKGIRWIIENDCRENLAFGGDSIKHFIHPAIHEGAKGL